MFCYKCGTQLDDRSLFCSKCGAPVAGPAAPAALLDEAQISPKSRLAATLLACPWLGVGLFGAHRFYLGKIKTAVVMLFVGLLPFMCVAAMMAIGWAADPDLDSEPPAFFLFLALMYVTGFAAFIWSLVDFIIAVTGNFRDGQGRHVMKW